MSTEYNRTETDSRTDDVEHGHLGEHDRSASGKHGDHQVIDAEVIDPDSGRDPKTSGTVDRGTDGAFVAGRGTDTVDETRTGHRHDTADGFGEDEPVAARPSTETDTDLTDTRYEADTERDAIVTDEPGHQTDIVDASGTEREPVARQQSPATDAEDDVIPLFDEQSLEHLRGRWRDLQGAFVDDPHDAVSKADDLVAELIHELTSTYSERKEIIADRWAESPDTESLRRALRSYRSFFNQLLSPTA